MLCTGLFPNADTKIRHRRCPTCPLWYDKYQLCSIWLNYVYFCMWFKYGLKAQKLQKQHALKAQKPQKQHALKGQKPQKQHALKGQKPLAQGIALGIIAINKAPCKGKSLINFWFFKAFALTIIFALGKIKR